MKPKHHFWSSLAAGGALYWATGSSAALGGAMLGGFAIDADHVLDQWWSIRKGADVVFPVARSTQSLYARYLRRRKLLRLPLLFHSYELLAVLIVLTLSLHTPFFYSLSYRTAKGFRRDSLIKSEYL